MVRIAATPIASVVAAAAVLCPSISAFLHSEPVCHFGNLPRTDGGVRAATSVAGRDALPLRSVVNVDADGDGPVLLRYTLYEPRAPRPPGAVAGPSSRSNAPIVLLHGLLGNRKNFQTIASALQVGLTVRPRSVYSLDLRNHGENGRETWRQSMTYRDMAADVIRTLDELGIQKCVMVGHSMGGKVAQAAALLHPERVEGLCVMDIAPVRYTEEDDPNWRTIREVVDALVTVDLLAGKRDADRHLRGRIDDPALRAFVLTNLEDVRGGDGGKAAEGSRWKINIDVIASRLHEIAGFDPAPEAPGGTPHPTYDGETFYINGGASRYVRHSHMGAISALFPNHMITTVRGAGHWVHAEAPDDTVALLKTYLER